MSSTGDDETISASKIAPLTSAAKKDIPRDDSSGATGTDENIDQARIDPIGGKGQYQNPEPRADDQGVIGRDSTVQSARIDPLGGGSDVEGDGRRPNQTGLEDEEVDGTGIEPLDRVREEVPR